MTAFSPLSSSWISLWMKARKVRLWGVADLRGIPTPRDGDAQGFTAAVSMAIAMNPHIMAAIRQGPTQDYADEYARVNVRINDLSLNLSAEIRSRGHRAQALAASERTDAVGIKGDFPHKTAATRAGLGWIGRHCQLVTRPYGSWVRLATVFTDMDLPGGSPVNRSYCGRCRLCVDACPAHALVGNAWYAGIPREEILDVNACDRYKKEHFHQFHNGHNCGICSAVCPFGQKALKRQVNPG